MHGASKRLRPPNHSRHVDTGGKIETPLGVNALNPVQTTGGACKRRVETEDANLAVAENSQYRGTDLVSMHIRDGLFVVEAGRNERH